ncbi:MULTISPECIES: hemolysin family protein [Sanguibacteroides]|uniref:Hemolysin n=1 Tax=Sanguibacteroides justesenii TaxID=1547597 RepID=A0AB34R925_9PORP|nr:MULTISPECIES: hemolysin family protein [Sanguibacteroides]KIO46107.1 hemolysin [Sanguibacteroides justesenii]
MTVFVAIITCLLLSAFFSGMEIAFVASNKLRIEIDKSNKGITQTLIDLFVSNSGMYITTILVGNNVVMVIYGIFMSDYLDPRLEQIGISLGFRMFAVTLISTLIMLAVAEFLPKVVFRLRPNLFLRIFAVPVFLFYILFFPISYFSVWFGGLLLRVFTGKKLAHKEEDRAFGKIDLNNLIEEGEASGTLNEDEHDIKLFRNALDFSEVKLRECMVPRTDIVALPLDGSLDELRDLFVQTGFSRILIYKDSIDNVIGYVHSSALFHHPETIVKAVSKILIVPETMSALRLLNLFTKEQKSVAAVVDEFGVTAGMVTIEDIMEEIFGEIEDEHDHLNLKEEVLAPNEYLFSGRLEVDYLNEKYNLDLPESEEYETLAGLILYYNEDIPNEGEQVVVEGITFEILQVKSARIEEVKVMI